MCAIILCMHVLLPHKRRGGGGVWSEMQPIQKCTDTDTHPPPYTPTHPTPPINPPVPTHSRAGAYFAHRSQFCTLRHDETHRVHVHVHELQWTSRRTNVRGYFCTQLLMETFINRTGVRLSSMGACCFVLLYNIHFCINKTLH